MPEGGRSDSAESEHDEHEHDESEHDEDAVRGDLLHRATIEFGLDTDQADLLEVLTRAVEPVSSDPHGGSVDLDLVLAGLADPDVADAAWLRWGDADALGPPLDPLVAALADVDDVHGGATWLRARQRAWHADTEGSIELLERARPLGHRLVLADLAAIEADRSNPLAAQRLLVEAGTEVNIDLDAEFDPRTADTGFAVELAEEVAPFAAIRPRPMAGRNERCPCGSGKKYKQCHLGNELHPLHDRAGWLYVKLMRFLQVNVPNLPGAIADDIVDGVIDPDLRAMVHESYLPVDLALFEGGIAGWFLEAKRSLLPADEVALLDTWLEATRSVFDVVRSVPGSMDVVDLATRRRLTVVDTVPDDPLEKGWKIIGRLVPVGDEHRAYGGFLPVNDDMVAPMLEGLASRELATVTLTIGQIFETATTHDEIQNLFAESLDTGELAGLLAEFQEPDDPPTSD